MVDQEADQIVRAAIGRRVTVTLTHGMPVQGTLHQATGEWLGVRYEVGSAFRHVDEVIPLRRVVKIVVHP